MATRVGVILAVLISLAGTAYSQTIEEGSIAVIQPRPVLVRQRVEFLPRFGVTINDPLIRQFNVGGSLYYYITEEFYVGPTFEWSEFEGALGGTTTTYNNMIQASSSIPELAPMTYFGALDVGWIPINGKFALFNAAIIYFDVYVVAGGGVVETVGEIHPAGTLGIGQRWFLSDWFAILYEVRDRMYLEPYSGGDAFMNVISAGIGVSFYIPPSFSYEVHEDRILDWD